MSGAEAHSTTDAVALAGEPLASGQPRTPGNAAKAGKRARGDRGAGARWAARQLERVDSAVYAGVGLFFIIAAVASLAYGIYDFSAQLVERYAAGGPDAISRFMASGSGAQGVINLVSDLLLTLIIMEVLGTVVQHLRDKETTSLKPFLIIGIISATRGILAIGARLSVPSGSTGLDPDFVREMIELGVNAAVIIALGATMKIIGDADSTKSTE